MWPCGNALRENSCIRVVTNRRAILAGLDLAGYGSYLSAPAGKPRNNGFFGGVAQLVRASACHAEGRGFEPRRSRHSLTRVASVASSITWPIPAEGRGFKHRLSRHFNGLADMSPPK